MTNVTHISFLCIYFYFYLSTCFEHRCVRLTTLTPSCAFVMKSENLNFLEPSGPLQACNGTASPSHVSSTSCSSSGEKNCVNTTSGSCRWPCHVQVGSEAHRAHHQERNCVNTTSGSCHSVSVVVACAGRKRTSDLHMTRPSTATRGCIDTIFLS